jgi:5,10-methylenetetrahydromethanopterin reductase
MRQPSFGVELYGYVDARTLLAEIQLAERLGFDSVWLGDSQLLWRDLWVLLGAGAATTSRITLASGVTNPVTRHPTVTAGAVMSLQELSGGRAILGIGVGFTSVVMLGQQRATRAELRRAVELIRALCSGESVPGEGGALRLVFGAPGQCPPIVVSGSGPKMLRLAGEIGDGVVLQGCPIGSDALPTMLGHVREGRRAAGRGAEPCTAYLSIAASVHPDRAPALAAVKSHVAVSLMKPRWPASPQAMSVAESARAAYRSDDHMSPEANARFAAVIPDAVIPEFAIAGTPDECIASCRWLFEGGIHEITIRPYGVEGESRGAAMEAFARDVMRPMLQQLGQP